MSATENIERLIRDMNEVLKLSNFASSCCDKPGDRMYHESDGMWWRRDGQDPRWVAADPPKGWKHDAGMTPENCKLVAVHDGSGESATWTLCVEDSEAEVACYLRWPQAWPERMTAEQLHAMGFETRRA